MPKRKFEWLCRYMNRAFLSFGLLGGVQGRTERERELKWPKKNWTPQILKCFKMLGDVNFKYNQEMFNTQQNDLDQRYNSTAMKLMITIFLWYHCMTVYLVDDVHTCLCVFNIIIYFFAFVLIKFKKLYWFPSYHTDLQQKLP